MERVVSATEARVHFGEIMRRVVEDNTAVVVERDGKPQVVIVSKGAYDDMHNGHDKPDWRRLLKSAQAQIAQELEGKTFPSVDEVIRAGREERDEQITSLRRRQSGSAVDDPAQEPGA